MIQIDDREKEFIHYFTKLNFPFEIKHLQVGDLCLGRAVIERKEKGDFVSSILDGRLHEQIINMQNNFEKCCIVLLGDIYDIRSEIKDNSISGKLGSICARTNVNIVSFNNWEDLTYFSYAFLTKANNGKEFNPIPIIKQPRTNRNLQILMLIEGISYYKALALISCFKEVKGVLAASEKELCKIEGIGKVLANRIINFGKELYT